MSVAQAGQRGSGATAATLVWLAGALPVLAVHAVAYTLAPFKTAVGCAAVGLLFLTPLGACVLHRDLGGSLKWLGWFLLAWWFSAAWATWDGTWPTQALPMVAFVLLVLMAREVFWEHGARLLGLWRLTGMALAFLALAQVLGFDPLYTVTSKARAVATLGNTNAYAAVAAPLFVLAAAHVATAGPRRPFDVPALVLGAASLVACRGKGGALAAAAGLSLVWFVQWRRGRRAGARRALVLSVVGVVLGFLLSLLPPFGPHAPEQVPPPTGDATTSATAKSLFVRYEVAKASWREFLDAPWLGHGPGTFAAEYPRFRARAEAQTPSMGAPSTVDQPHNEVLRLLTEGGVVATVLLVGAFLGALLGLRGADATPGKGDAGQRPDAAVVAAGLVAFGVGALTWSNLWDPAAGALGATLLGAALAWRMEVDAPPRRVATGHVVRGVFALALVGGAAPVIAGEVLQARAVWKPLRDPRALGSTEAEVQAGLEQVVQGLVRAADWDRLTPERQSIAGQLLLDYARRRRGAEGQEWRDAARTCLRRAVALRPWDEATLLGLAELEVAEGRGGRALDWLRRRQQVAPWAGDPVTLCLDLARGTPRVAEVAVSVGRRRGPSAWPALREFAEDLRFAGQAREAARILDSFRHRVGADIEYYQFLGRCLKELDDEAGYFDAMRDMQLSCAVESLRLGEWDTAEGNLERAARYRRDAGDAAERLLEAVRQVGAGDPEAAVETLAPVTREAVGSVPWWVLAELDPLRRDDDCRAELRRLGIPTARD